jgi:hypothetical protein
MALRAKIPSGYWYFCTVVDPLLSLSAVILTYFNPPTLMDVGFARDSPYAKITPSHQFLLHQFGGAFAAWIFLMLTVLRETNDMKVWTRFQSALAITDVAVLFSHWKALEAQGRLGFGKLRFEESSNVLLLLAILLIRIGFIAGWGFPKGGAAQKRA